ncbi:autophagy- protein 2 [Ceratobasidium sp. 414]|nr:autophagy- protein 2 [Ceratobasidium sp. 414]
MTLERSGTELLNQFERHWVLRPPPPLHIMFGFLRSLAVPLPTFGIALPANIQRRFLSFVLKYFLGHLVKPGQLDDHKIDAQIGSGRVEIKDVELDANAINTLLLGLPVSLRDGSLGNVSVRVPWPNVLAAPFSVSASGVTLTLILRRTPTSQSDIPMDVDLSASVASLVAEKFVHKDLSENEGNALRQSIHLETPLESSVADDFSMPGSMDPFLESAAAASAEQAGGFSDEEGVGVLTAVAERLMARFACSARDISITLIHEGHTAFHLGVTEFSYGDGVSESNVTKSISVQGFSVSTTMLEPLDHISQSYSSISPAGSPDRRRSEDDKRESMMQSIASLADSTMFQSAVSTVLRGSTSPITSAPQEPSRTHQILSFSEEPVSITVATRAREPVPSGPPPVPNTRQRPPKFTITASMGYIACAMRPLDVGSILRALTLVQPAPGTASSTASPRPESKKFSPTFEGSGRIRGVVAVLLLENLRSPTHSRSQLEAEMSEFFRNPTQSLSTPHFRARIDSIEPSLNALGDIEINVNELSVFRMQGGPNASATPILISDPNLDSQYSVNTTAPMFDIVDWTRSNAQAGPPRISAWRLRAIPGHKPKSTTSSTTAIRVEVERNGGVDVSILPLHFFIDLKVLEDAVLFGYGIGSTTLDIMSDGAESIVEDFTPPSTPQFTRSVADDMEQAEKKQVEISISCPLIRVQLRTPSPPGKQQRSGAIVTDLHSIQVRLGSSPVQVCWGRLLIALANVGDTKATTILSIGPPRAHNPSVKSFGGITPTQRNLDPSEPEQSQILIRTGVATTLEVQLPALHVHLSKFGIDGLQYWVDDASQWAERAFDERRLDESRGTSLIGSRFFARSGSLGTVEAAGKASKNQMIVSVNLDRVEIILFVPRQTSVESADALPFEITASGLEVLLEMKPDGKDETRLSATLMDAMIKDNNGAPSASTILARTNSLNLAGQAKPMVKLSVNAITDPETGGRENRVKVTLDGITFTLAKTYAWADDLAAFVKAPPGTFEAVVPTERLRLDFSLADSCVKLVGPTHPGALVVVASEVNFRTDIIGSSTETISDVALGSVTVMLVDAEKSEAEETPATPSKVRFANDTNIWKRRGFASLLVIDELKTRVTVRKDACPPILADASRIRVAVLACADTLGALGSFGADVASMFPKPTPEEKPKIHAVQRTMQDMVGPRGLLSEIDEETFRRDPEVFTPDMIDDDLPRNLDYLDESFGAAAGLMEFSDDELLGGSIGEAEMSESMLDSRAAPRADTQHSAQTSVSASHATIPDEDSRRHGGETIRMLVPEGIHIIEDYFETVEPDPLLSVDDKSDIKALSLNVQNCDITVRLHDGYDWEKTRMAIEQGRKAVRRRLEKIRQLLASGQVPDESVEDTHAVLFNSVYLGLQQDLEDMEREAAIAAIDQELAEDGGDTATVSSWQTFADQGPRPERKRQSNKPSGKSHRLTRSRGPRIEICLRGLTASVDQFQPTEPTAMRALVTIRDLEILDHIKTSTWSAFLTGMAADSRGNVRETDSNMVRAELCIVRPVQDLSVEEGRLKLKVLPIRLHVDQDALDFLKKFFMFKDTEAEAKPADVKPPEEMFLQHVEIFPIDLKLDYKPKRVDYRALREGRTIELMNFFHFEGAEMTLRHITLSGITGWARLGDTLNDLWTPDVKATQLAEIVAGIAPFRSLVRVGAGVADLVLLPTSTGWRRDRRREKGVRGAAAEAAALGARLATGAQVVLERAESMLGGTTTNGGGSGSGFVGARPGPGVGAFRGPLTVIPTTAGGEWDGSASMLVPAAGDGEEDMSEEGSGDERMISRYAEQPRGVREGIQSASRALRKNATTAAQTILAIPMEVYEQTDNEGPIRAVVRAVPIAVLRPMIGATEAVGQTLLGIRNSLDPAAAIDEGSKWKRR